MILVVYFRAALFYRVPLCISFAYPVEKTCGEMSPCSLKIHLQHSCTELIWSAAASLPLTLTLV